MLGAQTGDSAGIGGYPPPALSRKRERAKFDWSSRGALVRTKICNPSPPFPELSHRPRLCYTGRPAAKAAALAPVRS